MDYRTIIEHMNDEHTDALIALCKKFAATDNVANARLEGVDLEGLDIVYDGKKLRVEFPQKATPDTLKNAIIELCQSVPKTYDLDAVKREMEIFKQSFHSLCIASVDKNGKAVMSYAPYISCEGRDYIYISEVAEHFGSISANPKNMEVMFLQDESKAKSAILRVRLKYACEAAFIERESEEFNRVFDEFERATGGSGGIKTIRKMRDFHLINLKLGKGRFVKGFGQAYDVDNGEVAFVGQSGNPHQMPHSR